MHGRPRKAAVWMSIAAPRSYEVVGHVVVLLVPGDAVAANLDEVGRVVRSAGVDISPAFHQILDHAQPAAMRRLPQHRPTARTDTGQPPRPLFEDGANGLHVAPPGGGHPDLQKIRGLSWEPDLWQCPPSPAGLNAGRDRSIHARRVTAPPGVETQRPCYFTIPSWDAPWSGRRTALAPPRHPQRRPFGSCTFTLVPRRQ